MHFEPKTVIEAVNEDEREYLSDSDFESQNEQESMEEELSEPKFESFKSPNHSDDYEKVRSSRIKDEAKFGEEEEQVSHKTQSIFGMTENDFTLIDVFKDRVYMLNLIIIVLSWCASTVCFYIIGFYIKYIPGNVFSNIIITSIADALSSVGAGLVAQNCGAKKTLFLSFSLAAVAGMALIFVDEEPI